MKAFRKWNLIVYSYFEKGCRKKGTRQCIVGGFDFTVLQTAREAIAVCLWVLKESNNRRFDSYSVRNSVLIISHMTFRDCRVHIFPTTFIEIAVCWSALQSWNTPVQAEAVFKVYVKKNQQWTQRGRRHFGALKRTLKSYQKEWINGLFEK